MRAIPAPARTRRGYVLVASAAALWGCWSLVLRPAERSRPIAPAAESFVLMAVMFVALLPFAVRARTPVTKPAQAFVLLGALGFSDALNVLFFFQAMQRTSLAVAVLTHYLAPVLIALGAPLLLRETMGRQTWAALGLALGGLALLLEPWRSDAPASWVGAALGAASAVFYAGNTLLAKRLQAWFSPSEVLCFHLPVSLVVLYWRCPPGALSLTPTALAILTFGSVLLGAVAGIWFLMGLARVPASHASVLTLIEPLVAVLAGALVWGERLDLFGALGAALILVGAFRVLNESEKNGAPAPAA